MNYINFAIEDLKKYKSLKESLHNIEDRINYLEDDFNTLKGASTSSTPTSGGSSKREDYLINNIVMRERLTLNFKTTKTLLRIIEKGLKSLTENERLVLEYFYIDRPKNHLERLSEKLYIERSQVYLLKDKALYKFTINMYGVSDL